MQSAMSPPEGAVASFGSTEGASTTAAATAAGLSRWRFAGALPAAGRATDDTTPAMHAVACAVTTVLRALTPGCCSFCTGVKDVLIRAEQ